MANRFFPFAQNGGNGSKPKPDDPRNDKCYQVKPGDIMPLFNTGLLEFTSLGGSKYVKITEKGMEVIKRVNK